MNRLQNCLLATLLIAALSLPAAAQTEANGIVVLFTDYGPDSLNAGSVRGAVLSHYAGAKVVDLTHAVPHFDVTAGAYLLAAGCDTYPEGTTFLCIVDPQVGGAKPIIALETNQGHRFIARDNGLLTIIAQRDGVKEIRVCDNKAYWATDAPSHTFHARDIYAPVAAALAKGVPMDDIGSEHNRYTKLFLPTSHVDNETVRGRVILIDEFGNVTFDISEALLTEAGLEQGDDVTLTVGETELTARWVRTYEEVPENEALILVQPTGYVQAAINRGTFAEEHGIAFMDPVRLYAAAP